MEENRKDIKISERMEELAQKMQELEKAVEQPKTSLDDTILIRLAKALILGLEKAIDRGNYVGNRFLN